MIFIAIRDTICDPMVYDVYVCACTCVRVCIIVRTCRLSLHKTRERMGCARIRPLTNPSLHTIERHHSLFEELCRYRWVSKRKI